MSPILHSKITPIRIVLMLALLLQIGVLLAPRSGPVTYRRREFEAAFLEWKQSGSPAAKAVFDAEAALAEKHEKMMRVLVVGGFILINGVLFCLFWNYKADSENSAGENIC